MENAQDQKSILIELLSAFELIDQAAAEKVSRMTDLVVSSPRCAHRDNFSPGHLTASAWIVNRTGTKALLLLHGKLNRWLQPGGHADGNLDLAAVAMREAQEETGLQSLSLLHPGIYDLDIHEIPKHGQEPAHLHFDARFVFMADDSEKLVVSGESTKVEWIDLSNLTTYTTEESIMRMQRRWMEWSSTEAET